MITLIAAAAIAAVQPGMAPASPSAGPAPMVQMREGHRCAGQMADMKKCCCKDMMARMHDQHHGHRGAHSAQ